MRVRLQIPSGNVGRALLAGGLIAAIAAICMWPRERPVGRDLLRSELVLRDGTLYARGEDRPFEGRLVENFAEGRPKLQIEISAGKAHGQSRGWFENGQLEVEESFVNGVSHGPRTRWHANGERKSLAQIERGKIVGNFAEWYDNGQKAVEMTLDDGQPDGIAEAWHPSGAPKSRVRFEHGEQVSQQFWQDSAKPASPAVSQASAESMGSAAQATAVTESRH